MGVARRATPVICGTLRDDQGLRLGARGTRIIAGYCFFKNSISTMMSAFVPAAMVGSSTLNFAL